MDGPTLCAKQAPPKDQYRTSPSSALLTLTSSGTLFATSIACTLSSGPAISAVKAKAKVAGLHPAAGGDDATVSGELCSGDIVAGRAGGVRGRHAQGRRPWPWGS